MGRHILVGTVIHCGLDGSGIDSRWRRYFPHQFRLVLGSKNAPKKGGQVSFPGVRRPEHDGDHASSSSTKVKERVELYLHSPSGPSWSVLGWNETNVTLGGKKFKNYFWVSIFYFNFWCEIIFVFTHDKTALKLLLPWLILRLRKKWCFTLYALCLL